MVLAAAGCRPSPLLGPAAVGGKKLAAREDLVVDLAALRPSHWSEDYARPSCELPANSGHRTGVCASDAEEFRDELKFCRDVVRYRACVPARQPLWAAWNAAAKDALLAQLYKDMVEARIAKEVNVTPDLYVEIHYMSNPDCVASLRNVLCWHNFPKCDDANQSLPLCRSSCEQYYSNCRYEENLLDACSPEAVKKDGLFKSQSPGPDQAIAENVVTCSRLAGYLYGDENDPEPTKWYLTYWGVLLLIVGALLVTWIVYYMLVPEELQAYVTTLFKYMLARPLRAWQDVPTASGKTIVIILLLVFFTLTVVGIIRLIMPGWSRFAERVTGNEIGDPYKPPVAKWEAEAKGSLTPNQLRQLDQGCSCTGGTVRAGLVALPLAFVLLVHTGGFLGRRCGD